jgi:magnesium-transporting ATPase (P-type)
MEITAVITFVYTVAFTKESVLTTAQLLWINIKATFAALALPTDPGSGQQTLISA